MGVRVYYYMVAAVLGFGVLLPQHGRQKNGKFAFHRFSSFKLVKYNYMLYMNSPFSYKGKFIEGYTAITVLLPDMISKRLSRLIVASYYHLQGKRSSAA